MSSPAQFSLRALRQIVVSRLAGDNLPQGDRAIPFPADWSDNPDTVDHLYSESRSRLREQLESIKELAAKSRTVAGFATAIFVAAGFLGDLRFSFADQLLVSIVSIIAITAFVLVLAAAGMILWPRRLQTGVVPMWIEEYARDGATATLLKAETAAIQIEAFRSNQVPHGRNGRIMIVEMLLATIEVGAIVVLLIEQAVGAAT